jgi:hypothetical protein
MLPKAIRSSPVVFYYSSKVLMKFFHTNAHTSPNKRPTVIVLALSNLTLKISSDEIWVASYFGQPLTYPYFTIFSSDFLCHSLKS